MPRPPRCRRICQAPQYETFSPEECPRESEAVTLTLDEYEVIRLVDLEKKTHEQCASQMDISRTTVTEIYETARKKIVNHDLHSNALRDAQKHEPFCDRHKK